MALIDKALSVVASLTKGAAKAAPLAARAGLVAVKRPVTRAGKTTEALRWVNKDHPAAKELQAASRSRNRKIVAVGASSAVAAIHYGRNVLNEKADPATIEKTWERLPADMSIYHTQGAGNEGNRKYVSPNGGHSEAVLDKNGKHVTDSLNGASYNFAGPHVLGGVPHAVLDVLPYYALGNTVRDLVDPARFKTTLDKVIKPKLESGT